MGVFSGSFVRVTYTVHLARQKMIVISSSAQGSLANKSYSYIIKDYYLYVIYECTYLGKQFSKTFVTLQLMESYIAVSKCM